MKIKVLLIDDSEAFVAIAFKLLSGEEFDLTAARTGSEGLDLIDKTSYDLVLLDYILPDMNGLEVLDKIVGKQPYLPVVIITSGGSENVAVEALKRGASDYVVKSQDFLPKIPFIIRENIKKFDMTRKNRDLEEQLKQSYRQLKELNRSLEDKIKERTQELEKAYQLSNELMEKAVYSNMRLAELYSEVDESRRKLDKKIRELSILNEVGKTMTSTLDVDKLMNVIMDAALGELGVEIGSVILFNKKSKSLKVGIIRGISQDPILSSRNLNGKAVLLKLLKKNRPLLIEDIEESAFFNVLKKDMPEIQSFISVPLKMKNQELGVINIYGRDSESFFTKDHLSFVSSLASQASITLANISLTNERIQQERLAAMGRMTSYVIHDLKNSLTSIKGFTELIGDEDLTKNDRKNFIDIVTNEISRIIGMTQELLEFSRGKKGVLQFGEYEVSALIGEILPLLEEDFRTRRMHIRADLQYSGTIQVDKEKLKRVFFNLASNARDAMLENGELTIISNYRDDFVLFSFKDTGSGISKELQKRIFDPFVSEGKAHGTGLGMAIVKKIVDEHHGIIEIESDIGRGTTITVKLPQKQSG